MKCENSDCKSHGFFAYPGYPSERYCVTHKTDEMVNIRSFGKSVVRSTIIIQDTVGLRTQSGPSIPPSRVPKVKVPKAPKTPARTKRVMKVPGAPVKAKVARTQRTLRIPPMPSLDDLASAAEQDSDANFQPMMEVYQEIAQCGAPDWKVVARRIPLLAYCK